MDMSRQHRYRYRLDDDYTLTYEHTMGITRVPTIDYIEILSSGYEDMKLRD